MIGADSVEHSAKLPKELGGNYFDEWDRQAVQKRLVRRLEKLGYQVKLEPTSPAASLQ